MLPSACYWIDQGTAGAVLRWNYSTIATIWVANGVVETKIHWQGRTLWHRGRSLSRARVWVERWVAAQGGLPGETRRKR